MNAGPKNHPLGKHPKEWWDCRTGSLSWDSSTFETNRVLYSVSISSSGIDAGGNPSPEDGVLGTGKTSIRSGIREETRAGV